MSTLNGSDNEFRIVIVGGGIAGLATAIALRSPSRSITILERSRMNKEVGALISLQPNASKIVSQWGLDSFLEAAEPMVDKAFRLFTTEGKLQADIKLETSRYGADRILYHRQDLHNALKLAATSEQLPGKPAQILTGCAVTSCDCESGTVVLEDGLSFQGDLVIGADGIHSVIRDAVVGSHIEPIPTGLSAYRMLMEVDKLDTSTFPKDIFDPSKSLTTMIVGHDRRVIMGPGRGGKVYGVVALVPDEQLHESSSNRSWNTEGSMDKLLESYAEFPQWMKDLFKQAPEVALWQLRDIDKLSTWAKGRAIVIGDAAHAMLPTQGQGASQSLEDAEALQAFAADITAKPSLEQVQELLKNVVEARHERASVIQAYSRQQAKPGTDGKSQEVKLNPAEFMDFNCKYEGAKAWAQSSNVAAVA